VRREKTMQEPAMTVGPVHHGGHADSPI
jgi:hypothetical protein